MGGRWYAIEVDLDSYKNREAIEGLVSEGTVVAFTNELERFSSEMDIEQDDIIIVDPD